MNNYKVVFTVRFLGYFLFFSGFISFAFMLGPLLQAEVKYRVDKLSGVIRTVGNPRQVAEQSQESTTSASFANIKQSENTITPISTDYGIVIEKINANAKIIPDVNPASEKQYVAALQKGVAASLGSTLPGEKGNLYLFSHSTDAPWNIIRFNAIFYLLKELEVGDKVIIFYKNKRYDYIVFDKTIVSPTDISFLTNKYEAPVLTLQTCDPPGTLLNRLIVRAKLVNS